MTPDGIAGGNRYDERPMDSHNLHLVYGEAKEDVEGDIEGKDGSKQPQQTLAPAIPQAKEEDEDIGGLNGIAAPPEIAHDDGTVPEHIAEDMLTMELYGLTEHVLNNNLGLGDVILNPFRSTVCLPLEDEHG